MVIRHVRLLSGLHHRHAWFIVTITDKKDITKDTATGIPTENEITGTVVINQIKDKRAGRDQLSGSFVSAKNRSTLLRRYLILKFSLQPAF
jgi:hypothetical protein